MGDKVKVTKVDFTDVGQGIEVGTIGVITEAADGTPKVKFNFCEWYMEEDQLEVVKEVVKKLPVITKKPVVKISKKSDGNKEVKLSPQVVGDSRQETFNHGFRTICIGATKMGLDATSMTASYAFGFAQGLIASGEDKEKAEKLCYDWSK